MNDRPIPDGFKRCPACGRCLPIERFSRNRAMKDGLHYYCKDCQRVIAHRSYLRHGHLWRRNANRNAAPPLGQTCVACGGQVFDARFGKYCEFCAPCKREGATIRETRLRMSARRAKDIRLRPCLRCGVFFRTDRRHRICPLCTARPLECDDSPTAHAWLHTPPPH